jgi:hypothetical protein
MYEQYEDTFKHILINGMDGNDGFGAEDEWETDHWKHLSVFIFFYLNGLDDKFNSPLRQKLEEIPRVNFNAFVVLDRKVNMSKDFNDAEKSYLRFIIQDRFQQDASTAIAHVVEFIEQLKIKSNKKSVGRKKKSELFFQWMDYLTTVFGSYEGAIRYVSTHPVVRYQSYDTLKREYRRYRRNNKLKKGGGES